MLTLKVHGINSDKWIKFSVKKLFSDFLTFWKIFCTNVLEFDFTNLKCFEYKVLSIYSSFQKLLITHLVNVSRLVIYIMGCSSIPLVSFYLLDILILVLVSHMNFPKMKQRRGRYKMDSKTYEMKTNYKCHGKNRKKWQKGKQHSKLKTDQHEPNQNIRNDHRCFDKVGRIYATCCILCITYVPLIIRIVR